MIETKEHYYSIKAPSQNTFKSSVKDTPDFAAVDHQYQKSENIESVSQSQWLLVEYEKEFFLGIVLSVSTSRAHVCCLEKPYGISEPQDLEKENISIWYDLSKLFFSPVKSHLVQVKISWKYKY